MAKKKISKRPRYQRLRKLQDGGGLNPYYQNLFATDQRYQSSGIPGGVDQSNLQGLGSDNISNIGDTSFNYGAATAGLGAATGLLSTFEDNPYNQQFGYQGTSAGSATAASIASTVAPGVGTAVAGAGLVGELAGQLVNNYNEFGVNVGYGEEESNVPRELQADAVYAAISGIDPFAQAQKDLEQGEYWNAAWDLVGGSFYNSLADYRDEQEAAKKAQQEFEDRQRTAESLQLSQQRGANLGANPNIQVRNGGYLPRKQNGGPIDNDPNKGKTPIGRDATGKIIYTTNPVDTFNTASYTPNVYRPRTKANTIDTLVSDFNFSREDANARYSPELLDSIANTTNRFQSGTSSIGEPTLNEFILNAGARVQLQNGGGELQNFTRAQIDSTFNANRNVPFVNRLYNPDTSLTYTFPEDHRKYGSSGSHFLRQSDNIVYPEIQQQGDSLQLFEGSAGRERARQNKNYLEFKDEAEALRFSEQYKNSNVYENFSREFQNGGNISENNGTPIIRKYNGQSHEGNQGGIEVDQEGNPTAITGKQGIALTENGEVNFNGYIFSDNIEYK